MTTIATLHTLVSSPRNSLELARQPRLGSTGATPYSARSERDSVPVSRDHAVEVTRYGAAELHNIAAIVGGVASQEAVKLITHQYVPINHTWLYNGISSLAAVLEV